MFDAEGDAIGFLRELRPDLDKDEFHEFVSAFYQEYAEVHDTTVGWWETSPEALTAWAQEIAKTYSF
jgi:hypothetical protein